MLARLPAQMLECGVGPGERLARELVAELEIDAFQEEWIVIENTTANSLSVRGCSLTVAENVNRRPHALGQLEPGFILESGARIRLITGSPAKKAQAY